MSDNISQTIRENPIFASLTTTEAEELAFPMRSSYFTAGLPPFSQGQIADDMYVLLKENANFWFVPQLLLMKSKLEDWTKERSLEKWGYWKKNLDLPLL